MLSFMTCLRSLSKSLVKEYHRPCFRNRLCFRSSKSILTVRATRQADRHCSTRSLPLDSIRQSFSNRLDVCDSVLDSPSTQGNGFWLARTALHTVLERDPDFQSTVFTVDTLEECAKSQLPWSISTPTQQDFLQASANDLSSFICNQVPTMGREDFRKSCEFIAEQLPTFSEDDIIQITMSLYALRFQGGNTSIIWEVIDKELLARYYQSSNDLTKTDFFMKVTDVIFWLNFLHKSSFVDKYLKQGISYHPLRHPHAIQMLFYASCSTWNWRSKLDIRHFVNFLNEIKDKCPLNTFLVAVECFSLMHYVRRVIFFPKTISLPSDLQNFLLAKALENINEENILRSITQFFYSCSVRKISKSKFNALLNKINESGHFTDYIVVYYILHIMSNCRIKHDKFIANLDSFVDIEQADPKVISSMFLNLYGELSPNAVIHLASRVAHFFENGDISSTSEGLLLKMFVVLMDSGINLFHLWELTMEGDVIVPNFFNQQTISGGMNGLHLVADDCIEVNCPQYRGSRLTDALRMQLYFENSNTSGIDNKHSFYTIYQVLQRMSKGCVLTAHVLPGLSCPGLADLILCVDANNVFTIPKYISNTSPWKVKILPKTPLDCTYFVVWACPAQWPAYYVKLKERTLKKLGYISLRIEPQSWSLPDECIDHEFHLYFLKHTQKKKRQIDVYV